MKLSLFDYNLPEEAIAQSPAARRDGSRLLVLHRDSGKIEHRRFPDILEYLKPGDLLVVNNTRVLPARLTARKKTGAVLEVLVLEITSGTACRVLVKPGRRAQPGTVLEFGGGRSAQVLERTPDGGRLLQFEPGEPLSSWLEHHGSVPLPHYIHQPLEDEGRYQTVYNRHSGSAAAPTAGLHFSPELLEQARSQGVGIVEITLHVGLDTFRPVKTEEIEQHLMHSEAYHVPEEATRAIAGAPGRIVAVGTTSVRTLESAAAGHRVVKPGWGSTSLYITPGYHFQVIDALVTNFHVPRSSLLILVSAFAGREKVLAAYAAALKEGYRFLSLGDAMLIV